MKIPAVFALSALATLRAQDAGGEEDADDSTSEIDRDLNAMISDQLGFPVSKSLQTTLGASIDNIRNYGCWCFFGDDHGAGKGAPVDSVDAMCKNLHMAYDCAMMDYEEATGQADCVPWEVSYNSGISFGIGAIVDTCQQLNSDLCAQFACMAEGAFVINIIGAFLSIGTVNPANLPQNGFDFRASCPVNSGSQTDERLCCGVLPYRYPYKPVDRECCGASTYDPSLMDCCLDNVPAFSCI